MYWQKRSHIKMSELFPKPFRSSGGSVNVKDDLSNYATKTDLKNVTHVDTSSFAPKAFSWFKNWSWKMWHTLILQVFH